MQSQNQVFTKWNVGMLVVGVLGITATWFQAQDRVSFDVLSVGPNVNPLAEHSDLNGDGTEEEILLVVGSPTRLQIGDAVEEVVGGNTEGILQIVDIDTSDDQKEIIVSDGGPSGDPTMQFFSYDGRKILTLGIIEGSFDDLELLGSGKVISTVRAHILDTWFYRQTFVLGAQHTLQPIRADFYERYQPGGVVTVRIPFSLVTSPTNPTVSASLKVNDIVTITGCDDVRWCKVEVSSGAIGWFELEEFETVVATGNSASEVFEGLSAAD